MYKDRKKLVKAVEKGRKKQVIELLKDMSSEDISDAYYITGISLEGKTIFGALVKCPDPEIVDMILDYGIQLSYKDRKLAVKLAERNQYQSTLLKVLEHPKTKFQADFSFQVGFPIDTSKPAQNRAEECMVYFNMKAAKAQAEARLKCAREEILEIPKEIDAAAAEINRLADKLGFEGATPNKEKRPQRSDPKKYRMNI